MRITDRHKKPGGFRKLVNSLETTGKDKRDKILDMMRKEDPDFVAEVERCLFNFEEFYTLPDMVICEIVSGLKEMRTLAMAIYKCEPDVIDKFRKNLLKQQAYEFKEQFENLTNLTSREQVAARFRVIEQARQMEQNHKFVLKKYSTSYPDS